MSQTKSNLGKVRLPVVWVPNLPRHTLWNTEADQARIRRELLSGALSEPKFQVKDSKGYTKSYYLTYAKANQTRECATKATSLVADFYVLNYMWFWSGLGQRAYGYNPDVIQKNPLLPHLKYVGEEILPEFLYTTERLSVALDDALERSIRTELLHADKRELLHYAMEHRGLYWDSFIEGITGKPAEQFDAITLPLSQATNIFRTGSWSPQFGGETWAKACEGYSKFKQVISQPNAPLPRLVSTIDEILDLEHNTGCLLDKTEFYQVNKNFLDIRAQSRDMHELLPLCSGPVQKLVKKFGRTLNMEPLKVVHKPYYFKVQSQITNTVNSRDQRIFMVDESHLFDLIDNVLSRRELKSVGKTLALILPNFAKCPSSDMLKMVEGSLQKFGREVPYAYYYDKISGFDGELKQTFIFGEATELRKRGISSGGICVEWQDRVIHHLLNNPRELKKRGFDFSLLDGWFRGNISSTDLENKAWEQIKENTEIFDKRHDLTA